MSSIKQFNRLPGASEPLIRCYPIADLEPVGFYYCSLFGKERKWSMSSNQLMKVIRLLEFRNYSQREISWWLDKDAKFIEEYFGISLAE